MPCALAPRPRLCLPQILDSDASTTPPPFYQAPSCLLLTAPSLRHGAVFLPLAPKLSREDQLVIARFQPSQTASGDSLPSSWIQPPTWHQSFMVCARAPWRCLPTPNIILSLQTHSPPSCSLFEFRFERTPQRDRRLEAWAKDIKGLRWHWRGMRAAVSFVTSPGLLSILSLYIRLQSPIVSPFAA